ncbi:uncharacterized protein LOC141912953 [Tubulanus polymorphus]|uniref:uncharacterized protein LOC141912953 n=1 Tax=Tubulanus polymorphus TaxID=672921 RepID=UPI003DA53345
MELEKGTDTIDDPSPQDDPAGHGTHVTGTILGKTYGLAKHATGIAVRVLDRTGSGTVGTILGGIQWLVNDHTSKTNKKSLANMSLGGSKSKALNDAVDEAVNAGVLFIVAAGNEGMDSCQTSPASAKQSISAGCTDRDDKFCYFSNYGRCVEILAPGMNIISASNQGDQATEIFSGTSMSAPHIAGILAKHLGQQLGPITQAQAVSWLTENATKDKITSVPRKTVNNLGFMDCALA